MNYFEKRTFEGDKVPGLTKWLYTSSGMFRDAAYQFVSLFLLSFVQFFALGSVTLEEYTQMFLAITIIIAVLRIWDGFNDPIMGYIIEKVHFKKLGKYRPWIAMGALLNSLVTILMFWVTPTGWAYVAWFGVSYFLWDLTYTINDISFWAVLPSLSNDEKVRANLTTILSIFISIGTFAVGGIVPLLASGNQGPTYRVVSIVVSVLFALSQLILVIFMKERKQDEIIEQNNEKMKFREIFTVVGKNDQLRWTIIAILLYYTGSSVLTGAGLNYFYFNFGYAEGGTYQLYFTIVFAAATLIAQFIYPLLVNKLKIPKMRLFEICCLTTIASYVLLFSYVFYTGPATFALLCVFGFIAFLGQAIISLILYIMIQDSIDFNEWKFNERRESSTFALRAFTAKIASSLQQLILYVFLYASGLIVYSNAIANFEREFMNNSSEILNQYNAFLASDPIEQMQLIIFHIGFTIIPMLLFLGTYLIIRFKYKITEESHIKMCKEIEERKIRYKEENSGEETQNG